MRGVLYEKEAGLQEREAASRKDERPELKPPGGLPWLYYSKGFTGAHTWRLVHCQGLTPFAFLSLALRKQGSCMTNAEAYWRACAPLTSASAQQAVPRSYPYESSEDCTCCVYTKMKDSLCTGPRIGENLGEDLLLSGWFPCQWKLLIIGDAIPPADDSADALEKNSNWGLFENIRIYSRHLAQQEPPAYEKLSCFECVQARKRRWLDAHIPYRNPGALNSLK